MYEDQHFLKESFKDADLRGKIFRNCRFERCSFNNVKFEGCRFQEVHFEDCKIVGGDFTRIDQMFLTLSCKKCLIHTCNFSDLNLKNTSFSGSTIRETHFSHVNLTGSDFQDCDLQGSIFHQSDLSRANLINAVNFSINPLSNKLKGTKFSRETASALLEFLGIELH